MPLSIVGMEFTVPFTTPWVFKKKALESEVKNVTEYTVIFHKNESYILVGDMSGQGGGFRARPMTI